MLFAGKIDKNQLDLCDFREKAFPVQGVEKILFPLTLYKLALQQFSHFIKFSKLDFDFSFRIGAFRGKWVQ